MNVLNMAEQITLVDAFKTQSEVEPPLRPSPPDGLSHMGVIEFQFDYAPTPLTTTGGAIPSLLSMCLDIIAPDATYEHIVRSVVQHGQCTLNDA
jgi:hypothetical protein